MDKNQTTGFLLLSALLIGYMFFFQPEEPIETTNTTTTEVVDNTQQSTNTAITQPKAVIEGDSVLMQKYGVFGTLMGGESKEVVLENDKVKVTLNAKGGNVKSVLLKTYQTYDKKPLFLIDENSYKVNETIPTQYGAIDLNALHYTTQVTGNTVEMIASDKNGNELLRRVYTLEDNSYVVDYNLKFTGAKPFIQGQVITYLWKDDMKSVEKDMKTSRQKTTVNYFTKKGDFDYLSMTSTSKEEEAISAPLTWVSAKQKFFNVAFITDQQFNAANLVIDYNEDDESIVKTADISLQIPINTLEAANLRYYFGPNDYRVCEQVAEGFEDNVYLGWSWTTPLSKYIFIPIFEFLEGYGLNYGLIIFIMVVLVKSLLYPLTFNSYKSMAKMRLLKPEMDELKEKYGEDQMKIQSETMSLYRKVGANPLSGCIPMLAQMPFFVALYNFFPNALQLRGQSFLWADDLSTYDSVLNLPFSIPAYGDHVSLFTLLWAVSMVGYTYFQNQSQVQTNPQMKYVSYLSPVFFLFFFNSMAAGLTYYYFVSNCITIVQQIMSKKFVNEDKIRKIMDENKKKNANKKAGGFAARLDDAMKAKQKDQLEQKKKGGKK
ncbi:membrane protein insertase YidC [Flammeovirga kamogawensis]|uniref:Membrane protein insertase YidC n=1 Tax=Flammeovirga kamogawensis TaxID=373891 RepID=A0ABX8GW74_9BACT|nr:membrane protein insertase YidC [Flammeovirga kamogawensis]MBB6460990.1 YidC/Oxa1 family membrane protein insertase [Flammeovirga kamogawensis]QWG07562.1 membrane protein insertase YidC [Flammeovirga kamogawensis]TRX69374.1 membrane protein insertase YidC [Flammeovirga kamogawensis]